MATLHRGGRRFAACRHGRCDGRHAAAAAEPAARHGVAGGLRGLSGMVRLPGSPEPPSPQRRWQPMAVFPSGGTPGRKRGHGLHARGAARLLARLARPRDGDARHGRRPGGRRREPLSARRNPGTFHDRLRGVDSRPARRTGARHGRGDFRSAAGSIRHSRPLPLAPPVSWACAMRQVPSVPSVRGPAHRPGGPWLAPRLAACYKIAMGLTMGYMLILML